MDDDVTAFLAGVRMQAEDHHLVPSADVLPLLAFAEAALKLADEWDDGGTPMRALNEYRGKDQQQAGQAVLRAVRDCADHLREAVTREILGKGESGGA